MHLLKRVIKYCRGRANSVGGVQVLQKMYKYCRGHLFAAEDLVADNFFNKAHLQHMVTPCSMQEVVEAVQVLNRVVQILQGSYKYCSRRP